MFFLFEEIFCRSFSLSNPSKIFVPLNFHHLGFFLEKYFEKLFCMTLFHTFYGNPLLLYDSFYLNDESSTHCEYTLNIKAFNFWFVIEGNWMKIFPNLLSVV